MFRSINPATGQEIALYPSLTAPEVEAKLTRAVATHAAWRTSAIRERTQLLGKLADAFITHKEELARVVTMEMGKTFSSAVAEAEKCAAAFLHYSKNGAAMLEVMRGDLMSGNKMELYWQSLGSILGVMPWNFPLWQVVRFVAPAILAGNTALLKHASIVQGVGALLEKTMLDAGAPVGLFQNLAIRSDIVSGLIADARVAAVTLTGSEGAGMAVAEQAGRHLKKVVLELGGSDPFIVMPSANLNEAVKHAVKARIQNAGQSCICAKRIIVHADIYSTFLDKFLTAMGAVKVGDPMDAATDIGPLSSQPQRDTVVRQVKEAQDAGGKLLVGGKVLPGAGAFVSAGVLTDVPLGSAPAREEIFGPIAMVFRARDMGDAVRIANDTPYGLGASIWSNDAHEKEIFIRDIQSGMMAVNQMLASSPDAPFGGIKRSGHGRELGSFGLHEFMNLKAVYSAKT
jgi:succinate-semialdehyde dehydrogenase/glutarate-semialdehyde dehydrogenase